MAIIKVCENCAKEFSVPNRRSEQVRFCSIPCKAESGNKSVECTVCKEIFSCKLHEDRKYCSRTCFHASARGAKHAIDPNAQMHYKDCEVCGKNFRVTLTRKDTARWCSRKCQSASPEFRAERSAQTQGDKHWRWAGGLYKNHGGYIRHKRKCLGDESVTLNHRATVFAAMIIDSPNHPFLVSVDGVFKLSPNIEVHHIDRNRSNNALSNLLAVTKLAHAQIHHRNKKPEPWECWPSNPIAW